MPAAGPSLPTQEQIEQATNDILTFLREKYGVKHEDWSFHVDKISYEGELKDNLREWVTKLLETHHINMY